jgi:hypothetical protein
MCKKSHNSDGTVEINSLGSKNPNSLGIAKLVAHLDKLYVERPNYSHWIEDVIICCHNDYDPNRIK